MNRITAVSSVLVAFFVFQPAAAQDEAAPAQTQQLTTRDPQAIAILTQALQVAEVVGSPDLSFTASGTMTYYWAGEEVKGSAVIRGKGVDEFSLQVSLPKQTRSLAVSHGQGAIQEIDKTTTTMPYYNAVNHAAATLPVLRVLAAVSNASTEVSYEGLEEVDGHSAHHVRLVTPADKVPDRDNRFEDLRTLEVFIDASTFLILKIRDTIHAERDMSDQYARELSFSDYRSVNGMLAPFAITEKFSGQRTWSLQLDSLNFSDI